MWPKGLMKNSMRDLALGGLGKISMQFPNTSDQFACRLHSLRLTRVPVESRVKVAVRVAAAAETASRQSPIRIARYARASCAPPFPPPPPPPSLVPPY